MPNPSELERQAQEEAIENSPHERPKNAPSAAHYEALEARAKRLGYASIGDALTSLENAITTEGSVDPIVRQAPQQPVSR